MIKKLVLYAILALLQLEQSVCGSECIIATDEAAIQSDMLSDKVVGVTGKKDIPIRFIGREKVYILVCLSALGNGKKIKPFIVFDNAKRGCKTINDDTSCKNPNACMNI